ncbi:ammonia-forming cytochrome c nitrite reductase subunit c552 [Thermodesulfitimonas sp.]
MSRVPLKTDMKACAQCHTEGPAWLRERVLFIQDRTNDLATRAGNAAARAAKAIELANKTAGIDQKLLQEANDSYAKAYYRITFITAENSMSFHNPKQDSRSENLPHLRKIMHKIMHKRCVEHRYEYFGSPTCTSCKKNLPLTGWWRLDRSLS